MRRKKMSITLTLGLIALIIISLLVPTSKEEVIILVDGEVMSIPEDYGKAHIDDNGRTMIPLRIVSENIGHNVEWEGEHQTVIIDNNVAVKIGEGFVKVKNPSKTIKMDTEAIIINSRTYVPVRFILEALGHKVDYTKDAGVHYINILLNQGEVGGSTTEDIDSDKPADKPTGGNEGNDGEIVMDPNITPLTPEEFEEMMLTGVYDMNNITYILEKHGVTDYVVSDTNDIGDGIGKNSMVKWKNKDGEKRMIGVNGASLVLPSIDIDDEENNAMIPDLYYHFFNVKTKDLNHKVYNSLPRLNQEEFGKYYHTHGYSFNELGATIYNFYRPGI